MTTADWISTVGVLIQLFLLAGLVWYCVETRRLRIAAQSQIEALQTPCVTFRATPREGVDALLEMGGAQGAMILDFYGGDAVFINIGNGPAVNISYILTPLHNAIAKPEGYVSYIPSKIRCSVPISRNNL